jgi:hypothetical protein
MTLGNNLDNVILPELAALAENVSRKTDFFQAAMHSCLFECLKSCGLGVG